MIATSLFAATGTSMAITGYFVLIALVSLTSVLLLRVPSSYVPGSPEQRIVRPVQEGA